MSDGQAQLEQQWAYLDSLTNKQGQRLREQKDEPEVEERSAPPLRHSTAELVQLHNRITDLEQELAESHAREAKLAGEIAQLKGGDEMISPTTRTWWDKLFH